MTPLQDRARALHQIAQQIVRDHEMRCAGEYDPEAPYCSCAPPDHPLCEGCSKLVSAILSALSAVERQTWEPIETAPKDGTVILRPHRIWGAMDVLYVEKGVQCHGGVYHWINGDHTTAWPESAFLPFWMPRPPQPEPVTATPTEE